MTKQELDDRIKVLRDDVAAQRTVVQNCTARKPAIREARHLEELLTDLDYLIQQRKQYESE